nr:uncharacterized protein LOC109164864 [Ipomoea trifida]
MLCLGSLQSSAVCLCFIVCSTLESRVSRVWVGLDYGSRGGASAHHQQRADWGYGRRARTVKRFKHLKRSFVEVVADCPSFEDEVPVQAEESNWFEDGILIDSDKEDKPSEGYSDIPVVRFSKKVREKRIKLWRNALLVKYLGKPVKRIGYLQADQEDQYTC